MNTLRWTLGIVNVALLGGFVFLVVVANGFRRMFGASQSTPLFAILPVVGCGLLLAALIAPASKPLLHTAAAAAVALIGFCLWNIVREAAVSLWLGVLYLCLWLVFYGMVLRTPPSGGHGMDVPSATRPA